MAGAESDRARRLVDPTASADDPLLDAALEKGFPVRLIATFEALVTCDVEEPVMAVLERADARPFDHLPVIEAGRIVGLLHRPEAAALATEPAGAVCRRLDETTLIAADAGILTFLAAARASACRLVLDGDRITGIVTRSDLQKLPARALLFTLVSRLELAMAGWIRRHCPADRDWLAALAEPRVAAIEERYARLRAANQAIDRLTATMLADKRDVVLALAGLPYGKKRVHGELERIEALRDSLAHSGDYALTEAAALEMLETVALTRSWITRLPALVPKE